MSDKCPYRAYLLGADNHIRSVTNIDATDDASACLEAGYVLRHSRFAAVEVWEGQRLVWRSDRDKNVA